MPPNAAAQFSLLQLLCAFSLLAGLLAFTVNLGLYSVPLWLLAVLLWLILNPRRPQDNDNRPSQDASSDE